MKYIKLLSTMLLVTVLSVSCTTTEKFIVHATPGTEIYAPYMTDRPLGVVPQSGELKVEISSDMYCAFMLSKEPNSKLMVPFGLSTKGTSNFSEDGAIAMGWLLPPIIGACYGIPMSMRASQVSYEYQFTYEKQHYAIQNVQTSLLYPDPPKSNNIVVDKTSKRSKASSSAASIGRTSKARKTRQEYAKLVEGTYSGFGKLKLKNDEVESYDDILLIITPLDKNSVSVQIKEGGEEFFEAPCIYTIKRQSDGSYLLTMVDIPSATINISKSGEAKYMNDKVNIDGEIYTLMLSAKI